MEEVLIEHEENDVPGAGEAAHMVEFCVRP